MNKRLIAYWIATALTALIFIPGGVFDLLRPASVLETTRHLGYPDYFACILGAWKVLGGIAVLAPRFPRLKEWAYAGMIFDLTGATASHVASGDPVDKIVTPLVLAGIVMASWALRPDSRRLPDRSKA
jgi:uncharacterized membrane protein YphA (DoxX/SURF4 family)